MKYKSACYESVFIIRQDASSSDVDRITSDFVKIVEGNGGEVVKTEYWGLRPLKYKIGNNKRGHYVLLGIKSPSSVVPLLDREMKLSEYVIRFITIKVDAISSELSPILKSQNQENEAVVDVTVGRDSALA